MPIFVHLTPESRVALIRRNGIGRLRKAVGDRPGGIFAMPVCTCKYCTRGEDGTARMRSRLGSPDT